MAEALSHSSTQEVHKNTSTPLDKLFIAKYSYLVNTPYGMELTKKHESIRNTLDENHLEAKQEVHKQTREQLPTVRELKLTDIRSLAGLAHYINQSDDRGMQALEQKIGLDGTWKILALTGAYTTVKILESFTDILKFGEKTTNGMHTLSNEDLSRWEKARAIANGIGTDGLLALGITAIGVGTLGKVATKIEKSQIVIETETSSITSQPINNPGYINIQANTLGSTLYKEPLGTYIFPKQRGAVGDDVSKIKPFDKENGKSVVEESKVSEKLNSERKVIDIPKIVISFEEFEKLPWGGNMHSKEDLLKMYDKYKEFVSLSPEQQSIRIYELHTFLDENILGKLTYHDVLGAGNWGIVIKDLSNSQLAFKVNENVAKGVIEVNTHNRVVALIEAANAPDGSILRMQYKKDYGVDIIGKPPVNVDVPRIGRSDKGQFTMKAIDGESVLTKMFSEKQWFEGYEGVLESVKRSYPQGYKFTDYELYRAMADIYKYGEGHLLDNIRDPRMQQLKKFTTQYVQRNIPEMISLDDFLIKNGIHQGDLHGGNIIIPNDNSGQIYLIDFGEAVLSK